MQNVKTINVENSINSGQVFLWKKNGEFWQGINGQDILTIDNFGQIRSYQNIKTDFFRKKDNIEEIINSISKDIIVKKAIKKYLGLRLIRQDPFQCLISFIVSSNSNIPKIKINLENLCKKFGSKVDFNKQEFFLFPKPEKIANSSINEIMKCGLGYRSKFVKEAATRIFREEIDLKVLEKRSYSEVKKMICSIPGVGNKVADCTMLFSLNKLEAFPLDRWMIRILKKYYDDEFQIETKTITEKQYNNLHEKIVNHFGPYAGYGQQFLFKMEREIHHKKWL
ncbi:MAG: DNA glycosylase [Nitrosopumilus sp.]